MNIHVIFVFCIIVFLSIGFGNFENMVQCQRRRQIRRYGYVYPVEHKLRRNKNNQGRYRWI